MDAAGRAFRQALRSVDLEPRLSGRHVGTAVVVAEDWQVSGVHRLPADACFPGDFAHGNPFKAVMVDIEVPTEGTTRTVSFISAHAPPATRMRAKKPAFVTALAEWIKSCPNPVVIGIDANTPKVDHPHPDQIRLHWDSNDRSWQRDPLDPGASDPSSPSAWGEDRLIGPTAWHLVRDAYRDFHDREAREPVGADGPLAISYNSLRARYDHLLVSPAIHVAACDYHMQAGLAAGSDHALLTATITLPDASS